MEVDNYGNYATTVDLSNCDSARGGNSGISDSSITGDDVHRGLYRGLQHRSCGK